MKGSGQFRYLAMALAPVRLAEPTLTLVHMNVGHLYVLGASADKLASNSIAIDTWLWFRQRGGGTWPVAMRSAGKEETTTLQPLYRCVNVNGRHH